MPLGSAVRPRSLIAPAPFDGLTAFYCPANMGAASVTRHPMKRQELENKYVSYERQGHLVLCVTLSTYIKSQQYALSDRTRQMFEHHFIGRVRRCLPFKAKEKVDYDWLMEESPEGFWHYHGLMAIRAEFGARLWRGNTLNSRLAGDIASFKKLGSQRPFKINSFDIEPVKSVEAWCRYITKQSTRR